MSTELTGKAPISTGPKPRTCPNCSRLFQNSRGFHKHIYKCTRVAKSDSSASEKHQDKSGSSSPPALTQPLTPLGQKEPVPAKREDPTLQGSGELFKKGLGGKARRGRKRTLSNPAPQVVPGVAEGRKSNSPMSSPASVIKTRRSARSTLQPSNSISPGDLQQIAKRKRSPKVAAPNCESETGSEKKRKICPEDPLVSHDTEVAKLDLADESPLPIGTESHRGKKRRPYTRSRRTSKSGRETKDDEEYPDDIGEGEDSDRPSAGGPMDIGDQDVNSRTCALADMQNQPTFCKSFAYVPQTSEQEEDRASTSPLYEEEKPVVESYSPLHELPTPPVTENEPEPDGVNDIVQTSVDGQAPSKPSHREEIPLLEIPPHHVDCPSETMSQGNADNLSEECASDSQSPRECEMTSGEVQPQQTVFEPPQLQPSEMFQPPLTQSPRVAERTTDFPGESARYYLDGFRESIKSPLRVEDAGMRRSSVSSVGDVTSPRLKISPASAESPVAPPFSPSATSPLASPFGAEMSWEPRGPILSPKDSIASNNSKSSTVVDGGGSGGGENAIQFNRMLTDVRKQIEERQQSMKSPILTVGAALSSMTKYPGSPPHQDCSSPSDPPGEEQKKQKRMSSGRQSTDRSSSLPPLVSASTPVIVQHHGSHTTPTSPTGVLAGPPGPPLGLPPPAACKPSVDAIEEQPLPHSRDDGDKRMPGGGGGDSSEFSIPLNQGPSISAASASYFLMGASPVQGLEFRSQPPPTPHTQVFGFCSPENLIQPKTSLGETQASTVTQTQQNAIPTPAVTTLSNTSQTPPPPPPPLISTYHKPMLPAEEGVAVTTSPGPVGGIHPVVIPGIHPGIPTGKPVPYNHYHPTMPQEQMHQHQQVPLYSFIVPHHGVHTQHPLSHGMRALHHPQDLVYQPVPVQWTYPGNSGPYPPPGHDGRGMPPPPSASPPEQSIKDGSSKHLSRPSDHHMPLKPLENPDEFKCTQCGKFFKNKKALNGHMRKHGGAHGHKTVVKKEPIDPSEYSDVSPDTSRPPSVPHSTVHERRGSQQQQLQLQHQQQQQQQQQRRSQPSNRFTYPPPSRNNMDVLLEVAEQVRRKEEEDQQRRAAADVLALDVAHARKRPMNITIPEYDSSGKRLKSMSPPPITSPRCSIRNIMSPRGSQPSTPGILKTRQSFDRDEEPPMIHVGEDYQAEIEDFCEAVEDMNTVDNPVESDLMWRPVDSISEQEDVLVDGYLEFACSEAIPYKGRNKEYAMHLLQLMNYNVKEAMRALVLGKSVYDGDFNYRFLGSSQWKSMELKLFRRGFRDQKKKFSQILKTMSNSKTLKELHEYYYTWKKMKPAEYRGRQRHHSDDEELAYLEWDYVGPEDAFAEEPSRSPTSSMESDFSKSTSLSDSESIDSRNKRSKGFRVPLPEKRHTPDLVASGVRQNCEKSWGPLQLKSGGSLLGDGKFPFESPGKSSKASSLAKDNKSAHHSSGTSDSPKRQKINTKTADDRPGNYPCAFCGTTFLSVKSRSAHMKKHKYEDNLPSIGAASAYSGKK